MFSSGNVSLCWKESSPTYQHKRKHDLKYLDQVCQHLFTYPYLWPLNVVCCSLNVTQKFKLIFNVERIITSYHFKWQCIKESSRYPIMKPCSWYKKWYSLFDRNENYCDIYITQSKFFLNELNIAIWSKTLCISIE